MNPIIIMIGSGPQVIAMQIPMLAGVMTLSYVKDGVAVLRYRRRREIEDTTEKTNED